MKKNYDEIIYTRTVLQSGDIVKYGEKKTIELTKLLRTKMYYLIYFFTWPATPISGGKSDRAYSM